MHFENQQTRAEHIYYDVVMPSAYNAPNYPHGDAAEQDNRNTPIVCDPSQYELSILRLSIPGGAIPLKIMEMEYDAASPANVDNTIYSLQIVGPSNTSSVQALQWIPETDLASPPSALIAGKTIYPENVDYYSMYSLQNWCKMVNNALIAAYGELVGLTEPANYPQITFDGSTELFSFWIRPSAVATDGIQIFFNGPLKNIFGSSLPFKRAVMPSGTFGAQLLVEYTYDNQRSPAGTVGDYWVIKQDYSNVNTSDFMNLANIFVTSDLATRLQLEPNYIASSVNKSSANQQRNVLTNFGVQNGNVRQDIQYVPGAEYRRMEILNSCPLYGAAMAVFWEDTSGNLYPIKVPAGKSVNMLLLFEHV